VVTALAGITDRAGGGVTVSYVPGPSLSPADQATIAAAGAAVVVAGLTFNDEGEATITIGDRLSLAMPGTQDALIAAVAALNPRTVVVLEGSGPILMPWLGAVPALLTAWYPGELGGFAIGEVLFGDVVPSGKLPLSFPVAEADLPAFDNVSLAVTYGYYHGYRYLDRCNIEPRFPFGFGLSYTTYRYTNLTIANPTLRTDGTLHVTADVTNTGGVAGDEIVQLYVSYQGSRVDRPVKDLKGFTKVHLEPGQTKTVALDVVAKDLAFYDVDASAWEVEPIAYTVQVGPSSRDLPLSASFSVNAG
jgi:beta-glucosidase